MPFTSPPCETYNFLPSDVTAILLGLALPRSIVVTTDREAVSMTDTVSL